MQLNVKYGEISEILMEKTGRNITLSQQSSNTVIIGCDLSVKVPIIGEVNRHVEIPATFNGIRGNDVYLSLQDNIALLASGALHFIDMRRMVEESEGGFTVHLDGFEKLAPVLEKVHVKGLSFAADEVRLDFDVEI